MDKKALQALFRAKADERGAAKPSTNELRAARFAREQSSAQKQPAAASAAPPAAAPRPPAMGPPPPRNPQPQTAPMQPPPPVPKPEMRIESPARRAVVVNNDEPAGKRARLSEPQPAASTSASSAAAAAGSGAALPAGFFDNKAKHPEQPKLDPKLEWKLFQESVQENLQELENKDAEEQEEEALLKTEELIMEQQDHLSRVAKLKEEALKRKSENKVKQEGAPSAALEKKQPAPADDGESDDNDEDLELGSSLLLDWRARGSA